MYTYRNIFTRPNTNVPFYEQSPEFDEYVRKTYGGKFTFGGITYSADGLQQFRTSTWASEGDWVAFIMDPVCDQEFVKRKLYNDANNITQVREVIPETI